MKKRIVHILVVCGLCFFSIAGLFLITKPGFRPNHFNRRFGNNGLQLLKQFDLVYNSYYLAGSDGGQVYLANETAPSFGIALDTFFSSLKCLRIRSKEAIDISSGRILVDPPFVYLNDALSRTIYRGKINDWRLRDIVSTDLFADIVVPISQSSFILRTFNGNKLEYVLAKMTSASKAIQIADRLLDNQEDSIFSTDGMMSLDAVHGRLFYIYYYRNQFICLDTNLTLVYRGHTIDTTTWAKMKIAKIISESSYSIAQPPTIVNRRSCIAGSALLVQSMLIADNEKENIFRKSSVIDVYALSTGAYRLSFYIPDFKKKKIKDFGVLGNKLITIADRNLIIYEIDTSLIRAFNN